MMSTVLTCFTELKKTDGVVAFPTDTVWGMGCLPENTAAIKRLYDLKGRAEHKPLILHGTDWAVFKPYIDTTGISEALLTELCVEGNITVVFPATERVPKSVHRGLGTIGCRVPDCDPLRGLLNTLHTPVLATTSANPSGKPPADNADDVARYFAVKAPTLPILEAYGFTSRGNPSTVVEVRPNDEVVVWRQGDFIVPERFMTADVG